MAIYLPFAKLSPWQQVAFSAVLIERMLPNYQMFSDAADFGEANVLRNQLDLIWQWLDPKNPLKINIDAQLNKLELQTPDPEEFDFFGVFPALDVCMALTSLWQLIQLKPKAKKNDDQYDDVQCVSRLSQNSVSYYVELLLIEELTEKQSIEGELEELTEEQISQHPLMGWEVETQNELFDFLKFAAESKKTCKLAKEMSLSEALSNLGIEIA